MFRLREVLSERSLPPGYDASMGLVVLCGRRPVGISRLRTLPCPESFKVHFKSFTMINAQRTRFIRTQLEAMQRLFAEVGVAVLPGTTEDLSGNVALQPLQNPSVGPCKGGQTMTQDQKDIFANRNGVGTKDIVIYVVTTITSSTGNPIGCASHPSGQPGALVVHNAAPWLVAHEVGHVLGLNHVCEIPSTTNPTPATVCTVGHRDSLMFPNVGWTNIPPDLAANEGSAMISSDLTRPC